MGLKNYHKLSGFHGDRTLRTRSRLLTIWGTIDSSNSKPKCTTWTPPVV